MSTPFTHLLAAMVVFATLCSAAHAVGNTPAGGRSAAAYDSVELAELVHWHIGVIVPIDACVPPEPKNAGMRIHREHAAANRPDLTQWKSSLTIAEGPCVHPDWKSSLTTLNAGMSGASRCDAQDHSKRTLSTNGTVSDAVDGPAQTIR
jgi:hypothetical protein